MLALRNTVLCRRAPAIPRPSRGQLITVSTSTQALRSLARPLSAALHTRCPVRQSAASGTGQQKLVSPLQAAIDAARIDVHGPRPPTPEWAVNRKRQTAITGLPVVVNAREVFMSVCQQLMVAADELPDMLPYKTHVINLWAHRMEVVRANVNVHEIEEILGAGPLEELIAEAEGQIDALRVMTEDRSWLKDAEDEDCAVVFDTDQGRVGSTVTLEQALPKIDQNIESTEDPQEKSLLQRVRNRLAFPFLPLRMFQDLSRAHAENAESKDGTQLQQALDKYEKILIEKFGAENFEQVEAQQTTKGKAFVDKVLQKFEEGLPEFETANKSDKDALAAFCSKYFPGSTQKPDWSDPLAFGKGAVELARKATAEDGEEPEQTYIKNMAQEAEELPASVAPLARQMVDALRTYVELSGKFNLSPGALPAGLAAEEKAEERERAAVDTMTKQAFADALNTHFVGEQSATMADVVVCEWYENLLEITAAAPQLSPAFFDMIQQVPNDPDVNLAANLLKTVAELPESPAKSLIHAELKALIAETNGRKDQHRLLEALDGMSEEFAQRLVHLRRRLIPLFHSMVKAKAGKTELTSVARQLPDSLRDFIVGSMGITSGREYSPAWSDASMAFLRSKADEARLAARREALES